VRRCGRQRVALRQNPIASRLHSASSVTINALP
jgi:hypothetical protein